MAEGKRNWERGFLLDFNRINGRSVGVSVEKRYLSEMRTLFQDQESVERLLKYSDPVIYEVYDAGSSGKEGDLSFGTTIIHPGVIGNEYHMTRGYYQEGRESAFVCYTLHGEGYVVMENREGVSLVLPLRSGEVTYVPARFAHRLVNIGKGDLIVYYTCGSGADKYYETIEEKGFRSMVIRRDNYPAIIENPGWTPHQNQDH